MNARITGTKALRRTALLLGPILLGAGLGFGAGQDGLDAALASRIGKAKLIRVVTPFGKKTIWKPVLSADGIRSIGAQTVQVPWPQALRVQVRKRGTRAGLWIGSGVFAALGCAASVVIVQLSSGKLGFEDVAAGALVGGALGAGLGAAVGSFFVRWKTVYKAPSEAAPVARLSLAPGRRGGVSMALTVAF